MAMIDRVPDKSQYEDAIGIELTRLETIGEALIEYLFTVYQVTSPQNWL